MKNQRGTDLVEESQLSGLIILHMIDMTGLQVLEDDSKYCFIGNKTILHCTALALYLEKINLPHNC